MKIFKNRKAQQLVEFLLVAPFIVIFLGVLTEYAYALNCNMTLTQGLKEVTANIYSEIEPYMSTADINNLVIADLTSYLKNNNVPVGGNYSLDVGYNIDTNNTNAVFVASYNYVPAFTLPNIFFNILPEHFTFMATSSIPTAFLAPNDYGPAIDSLKLDQIWSSSINFSSLDGFNDAKRGAMASTLAEGIKILFLVPANTAASDSDNNFYSIVTWDGTVLPSVANPNYVNTADGKLYTCDLVSCTATGSKFMNTYSSYYNFMFVHDAEIPSDLTKLKTYWTHIKDSCNETTYTCTPIGGLKISDKTVDGILKRTLGIILPPMNMSTGNFDNIDVSLYNANASALMSSRVDTFGSMVFVRSSIDEILNLISGMTAPSINPPNNVIEFGAKVSN